MALTDVRLQEIANGGAGLYFLVYDNSQIPSVPVTSRLRLIVTNLPSGPVNSLVYIEARDFNGFKKVFGDINKRHERQGNFSARTCLIALENGPILVLNLRKFNDSLDKAGYMPLSVVTNSANGTLKEVPYQSLFDTTKLWKTDPAQLLEINGAQMFNFANIGSKDVSIFIRKSKATGYNNTIESFLNYTNQPIPPYVSPNDMMIDTMIDVFVFGADFSDNLKNMTNEQYGYLFTENGLKETFVDNSGMTKNAMEYLRSITDAKFISQYTGSLIPNIVDTTGQPMFIESIMNADSVNSGLIVKFNTESAETTGDWEPILIDGKLDYNSNNAKRPYAIDLVGHSYVSLDANAEYSINTSLVESKPKVLSINRWNYTYGSSTIDFTGGGKVTQINAFAADQVELSAFPVKPVQVGGEWPEGINMFYTLDSISLQVGDRIVGRTGNLARVTAVQIMGTKTLVPGLHTSVLPLQSTGEVFPKNGSNVYIYPIGHANAGDPVEFDPTTDAPLGAPGGTVIPFPTLNNAQWANLRETYGTAYNILKVTTDQLLELGSISALGAQTEFDITDDSGLVTIENLVTSRIFKVKSFEKSDTLAYSAIHLKSYKPRNEQFTDGTSGRQKEILDMLIDPSISTAIKNLELLKPRYIVDAFKTYIESNYKYQYLTFAEVCNIVAICNEAFVKDMKDSKDPYFKSSPTGKFDPKYIETGGNRDLIATKYYVKPVDYAYRGFFFGPGMYFNDNGIEALAPIAGVISKKFFDKYTLNFPYTIVANNKGILSAANMVQPEYNFVDNDERKYLEHVGYNAVIYLARKGNVIYGNNTAQWTIKTDLSKIHVVELVLFIQEQMKAIMQDFVFENNNYQNRLEVYTRANAIMNPIRSNGGVQYYENIIDESNNTQDIIENDMGILDTIIVAGHGMEKFVHRTYLERGANIAGFEIL